MPASTIGSQLSWAAYLGAAAGLILIASPSANGALAFSNAGAAARVAMGAAALVDSLSPGMSSSFSFHSPTAGGFLRFDAKDVVYHGLNIESSAPTQWSLSNATLRPGVDYTLSLRGDTVVVTDG